MGRVHKKDLELYGLTKEDAYNKKNGESELKQKLPTPASSVVFPKNKMEIAVLFKKKKKKKRKERKNYYIYVQKTFSLYLLVKYIQIDFVAMGYPIGSAVSWLSLKRSSYQI